MKAAITILAALTAFLAFRVFELESEVKQLQRSAAIAVLSAEAANNKVGAIAPYFQRDNEAFARAWFDSLNLPPAVFPDEVLTPLRQELQMLRSTPEAQKQKAELFR